MDSGKEGKLMKAFEPDYQNIVKAARNVEV